MVAHPLPADMRVGAGEHVKAKLEPVREAVSDFERFMQLVLGGVRPVDHRLAAF